MTASLLDGMTAEQLQSMTGAHPTTCRRWLRTRRLPQLVGKLLAVLVRGELAVLDPSWRGWRLVRGEIVSPENWSFGPGDVLSLPFHRQLAMNYQNRLRYAAQADWIEARYVAHEETRAPDNAPAEPPLWKNRPAPPANSRIARRTEARENSRRVKPQHGVPRHDARPGTTTDAATRAAGGPPRRAAKRL